MNFPEFLKYFDYHISNKIIDFHLSSNSETNQLKAFKESKLFSTLLFSEQESYLTKSKVEGQSVETIKQRKEESSKLEIELKGKIADFLSLAESCRSLNDYDTSTSYRKKIIDETPFDKLLLYCKIIYETGRLEEAKTMLSDVFRICSENRSILSKSILALWLIYCIEVVSGDKAGIVKTFESLNSFIDKLKEKMEEDLKKFNFESSDKINWDFKEILIHRSYLVHYGLFLILERDNIEKYLNLLTDEKYFFIVESSFSYMIKYIIVLTIISKRKNVQNLTTSLKNLNSSDPFSKLFLSIFDNYDLEESADLISKCSALVSNDYFLKDYVKEFIEKSRELIVENYISVNHKINVDYFSKLLKHENLEKSKQHLVSFIRSTYPLVKVTEKNERDGLYLYYQFDEEVIENLTLLKIEEIYKTTKCMTELLAGLNK